MEKRSLQKNNGARLSVVVPTYNCKDYLDECLLSILRQLPEGCELIVADDGSEDGTAALLAEYEQSWEPLRVIYGKHAGASAARNAGLSAARGDYVTFIDCDDCMQPGFLSQGLPLLTKETDLAIFGIERILLTGTSELWTVRDRVYPDASAFADEYIRTRQLMVYSNCNKFYRRSVIEALGLCFDEGVEFGEDRLFNYRYLTGCGQIVTSSLIMLRYIQRSEESMSTKHFPHYFTRAMELHRAKADVFLTLSQGTSEEERLDFVASDLVGETGRAIDRFGAHPEEKGENLPLINRMVFGDVPDETEQADALIVLGSHNCEYKVQRALEVGKRNAGTIYIVSGGNPFSGGGTEAEFMASFLRSDGIDPQRIIVENQAEDTKQNLLFSAQILRRLRAEGQPIRRVGIVAAGFHIPRARLLAQHMSEYEKEELVWIPAYSSLMQPDNWFEDPKVRAIVFEELRKTEKLRLKSDYESGRNEYHFYSQFDEKAEMDCSTGDGCVKYSRD